MSTWTDLLGCEIRMIGTRFRTRALTMGSGEPLLLLHGQGGSLENFRRNIPVYARHYRVTAIDFVSHGLSEKPPIDGALIPLLVEQVIDVVETLGLAPFRLEGQSQGGWVAATLALQRPEWIRKLVLTTPTGLEHDLRPADPAALASQRDANLALLRDPTDENVRTRMARLVSDPALIDDEAFEIRRWMMQHPAVNAGLQAASHAYLSEANWACRLGAPDLARLTPPTLLYWGSHNAGGRAAGDALAAAIPGVRYHCPDVGHWAQYEQADEHNRVVLDFLAD